MRTAALCILLVLIGTRTGALAMPDSKVEIEKLPPDGGERYNRLIFEKSPYLLQHAANPINWYPWGEEAFRLARKENKPIFLSIGYSTCHWCHVMEHESFSDPAVAAILNRFYVAIKVDREERPDIDNIYMAVCQALTGSGGWPLTILMTPERKPFFAGTYFPKESRYGRPGLMLLLENTARLWASRKSDLEESADKITAALGQLSRHTSGDTPGPEVLSGAYDLIRERFDKEFGGFGNAPKFPMPHQLMFLLRYGKRSGDPEAYAMVQKTLGAMRSGGIYDQVGFGFHRYSTDRRFLVPHFEKMLYDQALIAMAYVEAFQATGEQIFSQTAAEIFTYLLRDMTSPEGGFYSSEDADSEGVEGKFYLWSENEILQVLGMKEGGSFNATYNVKAEGNFHDEASGKTTGENILHRSAVDGGIGVSEKTRTRLFRHRERRVHPFKDDKILTSWNGLTIAALARAGLILSEPRYTSAAEKAAGFILRVMRDGNGRLRRRFRNGEAALPGYLDDYAFFTFGLIELYEATFKPRYLREAVSLNREMLDIFWDSEGGGFFFSGTGNEPLLAPVKEIYDGALPAGNSVALWNLLRLGRMTGDPELDQRAEALVRSFAGEVESVPAGHTMLLAALDFMIGPAKEIVIAGRPGAADTESLLKVLTSHFSPNKVVLFHPPGEPGEEIEEIAPPTKFREMKGGKATAYVCVNMTCKEPVTTPEELLKQLP